MTLLDYLQKVSTDEVYLNAFSENLEKSMADAGLNDDEKDAVRSTDREKIAMLVEKGGAFEAAGLKVKVNVTVDVQVKV